MNTLDIPARLLSEIVWKKLLETSQNRLLQKKQPFFDLMASLEALRTSAEYNTGSITTGSAWALYSLAHYYGPKRILEVGTFIGKSTLAMALGSDDAGTGIDLHTCDMSNNLQLPRASKCEIHQYPGQSSTAMLSQLASRQGSTPFDLIYLDGRLQAEDFPLLQRICAPDVVVALDDFEGIEKGVANVINIRSHRFLPSHFLIYPPSDELLQRFGFADNSTVALLVPQSGMRFTAQ